VHLVGFIIMKLAPEVTRYHVSWLRLAMVALRRPWSTRKNRGQENYCNRSYSLL